MLKNIKQKGIHLLVLIWMIIIFSFSSQVIERSNELSNGVTSMIVKITDHVAPESNIYISNFIVRKFAHFILYFVLGSLLVFAFSKSRMNKWKVLYLSLIICVCFSISDEFHQFYVSGRGAKIQDVIIDSLGSWFGIVFSNYIKNTFRVKNTTRQQL